MGRLAAGHHRLGQLTRDTLYHVGREPISVDTLISPLRYDILIRVEYFQYLSEHLDLWDDDPDEYLRMALRLPYFAWFRHVRRGRSAHWFLRRPSLLVESYRQRLIRSMRVFQDFQARGLPPDRPILLREVAPGAVTASGKPVHPGYCLGDGCHRFALLVWSGRDQLDPEAYRVRRGLTHQPIDNTGLLLPYLDLDDKQYIRFLSRGYLDHEVASAEELLDEVERGCPERHDELRRVIAGDLSVSDFGGRRTRWRRTFSHQRLARQRSARRT